MLKNPQVICFCGLNHATLRKREFIYETQASLSCTLQLSGQYPITLGREEKLQPLTINLPDSPDRSRERAAAAPALLPACGATGVSKQSSSNAPSCPSCLRVKPALEAGVTEGKCLPAFSPEGTS